MKKEFNPTTQEYVEIIHELQKENKVARVKDIAKKRGVTRSSVSTALNGLKKKQLVIHENYGQVELTETGKRLGDELEERHQAIKGFLTRILGLNPQEAEIDACKIEHYISPKTIQALIQFIDFIENCPIGNPKWLELFQQGKSVESRAEFCPFSQKNHTLKKV